MAQFIVGFVIGFVLFYLFNFYYKKYVACVDERTSMLIRQYLKSSARYSIAAEQDDNLIIAALHASYGAAFLWALKEVSSIEYIESLTGVDMKKFELGILKIQENVFKKLSKKCPDLVGDYSKLLGGIAHGF